MPAFPIARGRISMRSMRGSVCRSGRRRGARDMIFMRRLIFGCLYPRSGLGFRYRLQLDNTVGVIDSDYFDSDNEGHIMARITNDSREGKELSLARGTAFMQGIFMEYGVTQDDNAEDVRNGGFGSTTK